MHAQTCKGQSHLNLSCWHIAFWVIGKPHLITRLSLTENEAHLKTSVHFHTRFIVFLGHFSRFLWAPTCENMEESPCKRKPGSLFDLCWPCRAEKQQQAWATLKQDWATHPSPSSHKQFIISSYSALVLKTLFYESRKKKCNKWQVSSHVWKQLSLTFLSESPVITQVTTCYWSSGSAGVFSPCVPPPLPVCLSSLTHASPLLSSLADPVIPWHLKLHTRTLSISKWVWSNSSQQQ